jgi:uncharacterized membrane protein
MTEAWMTALWWVLFGGTHMLLTTERARARIVHRIGETGFVILYSGVAIVTFAGLVRYVARHRLDEPSPFFFSTLPPVQGGLLALSVFGFSIFVAGVIVYPSLPMSVFRQRVMAARGIQQVTRHPFFSGIAIFGAAHALLSVHPATFVFFLGFVLFAVFGALHQDRRLIARLGEPYRAYVASTSLWPFVAAATRRQRIRWNEQPWLAYAAGLAASLVVRSVHEHIFDHGGAYVIGIVTVGAVMAIMSSRARASRGP